MKIMLSMEKPSSLSGCPETFDVSWTPRLQVLPLEAILLCAAFYGLNTGSSAASQTVEPAAMQMDGRLSSRQSCIFPFAKVFRNSNVVDWFLSFMV